MCVQNAKEYYLSAQAFHKNGKVSYLNIALMNDYTKNEMPKHTNIWLFDFVRASWR